MLVSNNVTANESSAEKSARDKPADRKRWPTEQELRDQLQRPAIWGLALIVILTLAIQIWLLFL